MHQTLLSAKSTCSSLFATPRATLTLSLFLFLASFFSSAFAQKTIIYVSEFGNQGSFGTSWKDPVSSVERAMFLANAGDEIWVAGGNLALSQFSENGLSLKEGVAMYGGFAGTESSLAERDLSLTENASIIQGGGKEYTIHNLQNYLTAATILDGFTITGAANAGILNYSSSPTMSNLIVSGNGNTNQGEGGIFNFQSASKFTNVKVIGNQRIAGIINVQSAPIFVNCAIVNNSVAQANAYNNASLPVFINCTIAGESASDFFNSFGIYNQGAGFVKVYNSIVSGNTAPMFGIGQEDIQNSLLFARVTFQGPSGSLNPLAQIFVDASAGDYRPISCSPSINRGSNAYFASGKIPDISSVTTDLDGNPRFYSQGPVDMGAYEYQGDKPATPANVWYVKEGGTGPGFGWDCATSNLEGIIQTASSGDQIWVAKGTYVPASSYFAMKDGVEIYGGFAGTELTLAERDLSIDANKSILSKTTGPVVANYNLNLTNTARLDGFTIKSNTSGVTNMKSSPTLANLLITGVSEIGIGNVDSSPVITNCAIVNNAGSGLFTSGIVNQNSSPVITNCTIAGNVGSGPLAAGIYNTSNSRPLLRNTIVYGNTSGIVDESGSVTTSTRSIIQPNPAAPGQPEVPGIDPYFVNPAAGDFRLQPCSPAVNTGFNYFEAGQNPNLSAFTTDLAGVSLFSEGAVDMGAFQFRADRRELAVDGENGAVNVSGTSQLTTTSSGCRLLATLTPNGGVPLSGYVSGKVWIATTQPVDFVKRHYEITSLNNPTGATAKVTLYFTQQEFDDFNAVNSLKLPLNAADNENYKSNLLIEKRGGVSSNDTGLPSSYPGIISSFKPSEANGSVVWNAGTSRWEVSFDVTGFSGFFVKTTQSALPLHLISFTATRENGSNLLQWNTTDEVNTDHFEIQSSADAKHFIKMATMPAGGRGDHSYHYADQHVYNRTVYYRLKMSDTDGSHTYSKIVSLTGNAAFASVFPNPAKTMITIQVNDPLLHTDATLHDLTGRKLKSIVVSDNRQELNIRSLASGIYILRFADGTSERFVKE